MKTTVKTMDIDKVMALPRYPHKLPRKPGMFWRTLIKALTYIGMAGTKFTYETERMELLGKDEPCLILMNHSCFLDMQIAYRILYPRAFNIIATSDSFVGLWGLMEWVMRTIGCIPTQKFVTDIGLLQDMNYCFKTLGTSILMYPEASYSFDGTATALPRKMGVLLKKLGVPVVTVITEGAFAIDPLYNGLQKRKVNVRADVKCLATAEEVKSMTVAQLDALLDEAFSFDNFAWQQKNNVIIDEPFRADGLNRILFRCPHCGAEGNTEGKGTTLICHSCGVQYELTETGYLKCLNAEGKFTHIPDWYKWEREQVRASLQDGSYKLETDVDIAMMVDFKAIYRVGEGHLVHDENGFRLTGCDGKLEYSQPPLACYGLYADYYWYELGDVICIGNNDALYYCFPQCGDVVAKTRMATEELYKLKKTRPAKVTQ